MCLKGKKPCKCNIKSNDWVLALQKDVKKVIFNFENEANNKFKFKFIFSNFTHHMFLKAIIGLNNLSCLISEWQSSYGSNKGFFMQWLILSGSYFLTRWARCKTISNHFLMARADINSRLSILRSCIWCYFQATGPSPNEHATNRNS